MRNRNKHYRFSEIIESGSFIFPLLIFITVFIVVPVIGTIINSFFRDITFAGKGFIWLSNYKQLLSDAKFWQSFRFTLLFVLVSVPLELILGLFFAQLINQPSRVRTMLRVCILLPWAVPAAISGRIWQLLYNYSYGLANFLVTKIGLANSPVNWLGTDISAFSSLVIADAWKTTPFVAIILLAGLQTIPLDLYKQARIDRASFIQTFSKVTLPLLKPVIIVALLFRTIDCLRIFDLIYVLTNGGPGGATNSLSLYGYKYFLAGDFGYGSSVSVILFIIAAVLSILYLKLGKFKEAVTG